MIPLLCSLPADDAQRSVPCPFPSHRQNQTRLLSCSNKAVLAFGSHQRAQSYGHRPCSPKAKRPLNFLPKNRPCRNRLLTRRYSSLLKIFMMPAAREVLQGAALSSLSLCSLSRVASLLSTVGWQGRRDFFFSPFSFTPPTPFWEAASSAAGSCQSKGHRAKEACWPLGSTCLPPPHASYSQSISLEQGLITIQLSGRHSREWEKPGSTEQA